MTTNRWLALLLILVFLAGLAGCEGDPGYVQNTIDKKKEAEKKIWLITARHALDLYRAQQQKWPEKLQEVPGIPKLPEPLSWIYNNKTGQIIIGERRK